MAVLLILEGYYDIIVNDLTIHGRTNATHVTTETRVTCFLSYRKFRWNFLYDKNALRA